MDKKDVIDKLINSMEKFGSASEFATQMEGELSKETLLIVWEKYWELDPIKRFHAEESVWENWLSEITTN